MQNKKATKDVTPYTACNQITSHLLTWTVRTSKASWHSQSCIQQMLNIFLLSGWNDKSIIRLVGSFPFVWKIVSSTSCSSNSKHCNLLFFVPEWHLGSKLSLQCYRNAQGKIWPAGSQADVHNYVQRGSSQREEVILGWVGNQRWVSVIVWVSLRGLQFLTWWRWWARLFHFEVWTQYLGPSHDLFQVF